MSWRDVLARAATSVGAPTAAPALVQFVELFERWNQRINLSAARSLDDIAQHVVDSLALLPHVGEAASLVDVGSGGGFPLIVLGAWRPTAGCPVSNSRASASIRTWIVASTSPPHGRHSRSTSGSRLVSSSCAGVAGCSEWKHASRSRLDRTTSVTLTPPAIDSVP